MVGGGRGAISTGGRPGGGAVGYWTVVDADDPVGGQRRSRRRAAAARRDAWLRATRSEGRAVPPEDDGARAQGEGER